MSFRWIAVPALLALWIPTPAQRGRVFVSIEAHVGTAHSVHVGFVKQLEPTEHEKPKEGFYPGEPHRVTFTVSETIKGAPAKSLDLILTLQQTSYLEYMRDNAIEVMLVGTSQSIDEEAEIGLGDPGSRYSFRILQPIRHPKNKPETEWIGKQLNTSLNEGRMFDMNLNVISRREEVLKRARAFAKKYPEVLKAHYFPVPNEFGVKCGYTNAYCFISLPLCPESKKLAIQLERDPSRLFKDVREKDLEVERKSVAEGVRRFLSHFRVLGRASRERWSFGQEQTAMPDFQPLTNTRPLRPEGRWPAFGERCPNDAESNPTSRTRRLTNSQLNEQPCVTPLEQDLRQHWEQTRRRDREVDALFERLVEPLPTTCGQHLLRLA